MESNEAKRLSNPWLDFLQAFGTIALIVVIFAVVVWTGLKDESHFVGPPTEEHLIGSWSTDSIFVYTIGSSIYSRKRIDSARYMKLRMEIRKEHTFTIRLSYCYDSSELRWTDVDPVRGKWQVKEMANAQDDSKRLDFEIESINTALIEVHTASLLNYEGKDTGYISLDMSVEKYHMMDNLHFYREK